LLILAASMLSWAGMATAATHTVDQAHSFFMFRAVRGGIAHIYGRFNDFEGTLELEGDDFAGASIELSVSTASVDSGVERRDNHLRSPDFLNSAEIPRMTFKSTSVEKKSDSTFTVTGDLSLHGVVKSVTAEVEVIGTGTDRGGKSLIGFEGTFVIDRSDFKMEFMPGFIGNELQILFAVQAVGN